MARAKPESLMFLVQTKREGLLSVVEQKLVFSISGQRFP
jgi:hypothetical protein